MNALKIYKSSAGSGKTFILVKEYLRLVLQHPEDYRHILAVTFTNKAASEMKGRIVEALVEISKGNGSALRDVLAEELPGIKLDKQADRALKLILHNYSSFSVSTIDSFFQRILRALAREMHLPLRLEVEIGLDDAILEVTDRLLKEVGIDPDLTEWLGELILQKLEDDKGWNVESDIHLVANELFKEHYDESRTLSRQRIREIYDQLKTIRRNFEQKMRECGNKAVRVMESSGLAVADFAYGKSGVMGYLDKLRTAFSPDDFKLKVRAQAALDDPEKWSTKSSKLKEQIQSAVAGGLGACLQEANDIFQRDYKEYLSASEALRRIYMFGIANDIIKKFSEYRNENNVILLADTPKMLSEIITGQDAPFIYEKAGNRYKHLLIDEFQDTSSYQWKNLLPLINNTLGSGNMALVVGDAKQSIYRWRGGNMNLLVVQILADLRHFQELYRAEVLSTNFRSRNDVVEFNNDFFKAMPEIIRQGVHPDGHHLLDLAYSNDLIQSVAGKNKKPGYVKINFLEKEGESFTEEDQEDGEDDNEATGWKDTAMKKMLENIRSLLKQNYAYRDIAILVRRNIEGNEVAQYLLEQGISQIISPDSLLIASAPRIRFLVNVMRFLSNTKDAIARSELIYYYTRYILKNPTGDYHAVFSDHLVLKKKSSTPKEGTLFHVEGLEDTLFNKLLPEEFTQKMAYLSKLPVYDLCEQLIRIFSFSQQPDAYIQRFQDLVLEYTASNNSSLDGFLDWWNESKSVKNCSVLIPENEDAIRIMTVHKSKGLQFPVVIMPFADWRILPRSNDLFWAHAAEEPYAEMGRVAVLISNRLLDTYFSAAYQEEVMQTVIDNLNVLYVAFTRAEEQLYVYCPVNTGKDKEVKNIPSLLWHTLEAANCKVSDGVYERGDVHLKQEKQDAVSSVQCEKLKVYTCNLWQEKIGITSRAAGLLEILGEKVREKINYGLLIHRILSEVKVISDLDKAIDRILFEGMISLNDRENILLEIKELLAVPGISHFFSPDWEVKNEQDIILPEGDTLRPDRVLIRKDQTLVIDFKTGKVSPTHERQIKNYASVLRNMGYPSVKSYLVYIGDKKVIEVEDQL